MQQLQRMQLQQQQQTRLHRQCRAGCYPRPLTQQVLLHQGLQKRLRLKLMLLQASLL
jgi:hypothetical protein